MPGLNDAVKAFQELMATLQPRMQYRSALTGDGAGTVDIAAEPGYSWVRYVGDQNKVSKVLNIAAPGLPEDFPVIIGKRYPEDAHDQVLFVDWALYTDTLNAAVVAGYTTGKHGETHNAATGLDPAPIDLRNILDLRVRASIPADYFVYCEKGQYYDDGLVVRWMGGNIDLSGSVPAIAGHMYVLVYLDSTTNVLSSVDGVIVPLAATPPIPALTANMIPLALAHLAFGQADIDEDDIYDWRFLWSTMQHNLLGLTHGDTLAGAVVQGDLVVGNVTPAWARLARGSAHEMLKMNAAGTTPGYEAFDWDEMSGVVGADMAHSHVSDAEGGQFPFVAFIAKNTSGGVAAANDVGYINEDGEYKTTTTAFADLAWCVVITGGANNADIYVANRGRVTIVLDMNCNVGDYLYTSTTATQATVLDYVAPTLFAVALTANAGGAGGTCSALLLCHTKVAPLTSANELFRCATASSTTTAWAGTIAGLPGGAVLTYNVTAGNEDTLVPYAGMLTKLMLHNTTRGDFAYISAVNTGTNTITLTANVPAGWIVTDVITAQSQTCGSLVVVNGYDYEIQSTEIDALARGLEIIMVISDSGAVDQRFLSHPWVALATSRLVAVHNDSTAIGTNLYCNISLVARRFVLGWEASGAGTATPLCRVRAALIAAP